MLRIFIILLILAYITTLVSLRVIINNYFPQGFSFQNAHYYLNGNLEFRPFPWPRFEIGNITLLEKKYPRLPLANIKKVKVSLALLPLLWKRLIINSITIEEGSFIYYVDENGYITWRNLWPKTPPPAAPVPARKRAMGTSRSSAATLKAVQSIAADALPANPLGELSNVANPQQLFSNILDNPMELLTKAPIEWGDIRFKNCDFYYSNMSQKILFKSEVKRLDYLRNNQLIHYDAKVVLPATINLSGIINLNPENTEIQAQGSIGLKSAVPFNLKSALLYDWNGFALDNFSLNLRSSNFKGQLVVPFMRGMSLILASEQINVDELLQLPLPNTPQWQPSQQTTQYFWLKFLMPELTLQLSRLQIFGQTYQDQQVIIGLNSQGFVVTPETPAWLMALLSYYFPAWQA